MQDASSISLIKVLIPLNYISLAPTRVIIASIIGISALVHGTKHPTCASSTQIAVYRIKVLFPPIFGPVIMWNRDFSESMKQSFATQLLFITSKQGCRDSIRFIYLFSARMFGFTYGLGDDVTRQAKLAKTSYSEMRKLARSIA